MTKDQDHLAEYRGDLRGAEKKLASELNLGFAVVPMGIAAIGLITTYFMPHSGKVLGFDVLFNTDIAQKYFTTTPERIYTVILLIGILLTFATIFVRTTALAFVTWAVTCVQSVYSIFAGWMRQSRPPEQPGEGIAWGLALGIFLSIVLAVTMSFVAFRKTNLQKSLAAARRAEADSDPVSRAQQQYLRSGLTPHTVTEVEIVDDRRERVKARREAKARHQAEAEGQ